MANMRHYFKNALPYEKQGHLCTADPAEKSRIIQQIRTLMNKLENTPCIPRHPVAPDLKFLERKQPRFKPDPDLVPTITHVPLLEIRPTSDYRKIMKNAVQWQNIVFVDVPPPLSTHASPPWALPEPEAAAQEKLPCPTKHCVCCPHLLTKYRDEILCHAVGERRQNYLNQIRCILEQMDDTPCVRRTGGDRKPIIEYPGYVNMKNPAYARKKPADVPMIVNVPVQELRPTSEYWKHVHENDKNLQYYAVTSNRGMSHQPPQLAQRKKSSELIGGWIISGCDCSRHNGIQDDCRRTECQNNPKCKTDPPSCGPSSTYRQVPNINLEEKFQNAIMENQPKKKNYCCCDPHSPGNMDPRGLPQGFEAFPCKYH